MVLHRNAKLGLAGRYALARAVEEGCRCGRRRPRSACRRRRPAAGRGGGAARARRSVQRLFVSMIARALGARPSRQGSHRSKLKPEGRKAMNRQEIIWAIEAQRAK